MSRYGGWRRASIFNSCKVEVVFSAVCALALSCSEYRLTSLDSASHAIHNSDQLSWLYHGSTKSKERMVDYSAFGSPNSYQHFFWVRCFFFKQFLQPLCKLFSFATKNPFFIISNDTGQNSSCVCRFIKTVRRLFKLE